VVEVDEHRRGHDLRSLLGRPLRRDERADRRVRDLVQDADQQPAAPGERPQRVRSERRER